MRLKKRYIVLIVLLCLLLGAGAFFGPKIYRAVRVYRLAEEFLAGQEQSLDVTVQTEGNKNVFFRLDWQEVQGGRIYTLESGGETVYCCDGVLYLKNGKGYGFFDALPDLTPILEKPWILYPLVQIQQEGNQWLLSVSAQDLIPQIRNLNVTMEEGEGGIHTLYCNTWGAEIGDFVGLKAVTRDDRAVSEVPRAVLDAIESGTLQGGKDLTQDMIRLLKGWVLLNNKDPLGMELNLNVDLLSLPLNTRIQLYTTKAYDKPISYLSKDGVGFYFTDKAACTTEGVKIGSPDSSVDTAKLLGFAYYLCFNGDLSCEADTYRLVLDQTGMEQVLYTIAPEAKDMALTLTEGALELKMEGDTIASIFIRVMGQMDLMVTQVDIGAGVQINIVQEDFVLDIPEAVLDALLE